MFETENSSLKTEQEMQFSHDAKIVFFPIFETGNDKFNIHKYPPLIQIALAHWIVVGWPGLEALLF